jgi:hypothetical protein
MNCRDCEPFLQEYLDSGFAEPRPAAVLAHLQECPACRELFAVAERLNRGSRLLPSPALPPGFAERVTLAVLRERRRRVVLQFAFRAAAAVLIVTLGSWLVLSRWQLGPAPGDDLFIPPVAKKIPEPEGPGQSPRSLAAQFNEAREATAGITQLALDTARGARLLLPPADRMTPEISSFPVEPPAVSVAEVSRTVAEGFEPVTDSARRAWGMFRRMVPAGDEKKKG